MRNSLRETCKVSFEQSKFLMDYELESFSVKESLKQGRVVPLVLGF